MTANAGSVTRAADQLRTSQSSLSIQLKILERNVEKKLFRKSGRKLVLTEEGDRVLQYCRAAFANFENLSEHLRHSGKAANLKIHCGVSDEVERPFVTDVIGTLLKQKSAAFERVRLISLPHDQLILKLRAREIDTMLTTRHVTLPDVGLVAEFKLPVALVASKSAAKDAKFKPNQLLKLDSSHLAVVSTDHLFRQEIENYMAKHGLQKATVFESNVLASVTRAIVDGFCIGFVPLPYVYKELEAGKVSVVGGKKLWEHSVYLYSRQGELVVDLKTHLEKLIRLVNRRIH